MYKSFRDMPVWQEAMDVAAEIYRVSELLPREEKYGLRAQLRRAAASISANIAEAFGRNHTRDKVNFYYYARGSVNETQNHLLYAVRVGYLENEEVSALDRRLDKIYGDLNKIIVSYKAKY